MGWSARMLALGAVAGTGLAVVSGAAGWGTAHRVLAVVAVPPLVALAVRSRRALVPLALFGVAALVIGRPEHLTFAALLLFTIVFIWTPPHFWALALLIKDNYANARVPMLPVVRGDRATARQIVVYSLVLVAATLLPWAWGGAGPLYVVCALALGAVFVWLAERLRRDTTPRRAMILFHYSLLYLALLFVALAVDAVIG